MLQHFFVEVEKYKCYRVFQQKHKRNGSSMNRLSRVRPRPQRTEYPQQSAYALDELAPSEEQGVFTIANVMLPMVSMTAFLAGLIALASILMSLSAPSRILIAIGLISYITFICCLMVSAGAYFLFKNSELEPQEKYEVGLKLTVKSIKTMLVHFVITAIVIRAAELGAGSKIDDVWLSNIWTTSLFSFLMIGACALVLLALNSKQSRQKSSMQH